MISSIFVINEYEKESSLPLYTFKTIKSKNIKADFSNLEFYLLKVYVAYYTVSFCKKIEIETFFYSKKKLFLANVYSHINYLSSKKN